MPAGVAERMTTLVGPGQGPPAGVSNQATGVGRTQALRGVYEASDESRPTGDQHPGREVDAGDEGELSLPRPDAGVSGDAI